MEGIIRPNLVFLSDNLIDIEKVAAQLYSKNLIPKNESDKIGNQEIEFQKGKLLWEILMKKDIDDFPLVLEILKLTENLHLAKRLEETHNLNTSDRGTQETNLDEILVIEETKSNKNNTIPTCHISKSQDLSHINETADENSKNSFQKYRDKTAESQDVSVHHNSCVCRTASIIAFSILFSILITIFAFDIVLHVVDFKYLVLSFIFSLVLHCAFIVRYNPLHMDIY